MPRKTARRRTTSTPGQQGAPLPSAARIADRLHGVAIQLLRRLRKEDASSGLTGPRASALSVIVFAGPLSLGDLAGAEQVKPPTMTRLVDALERQKLIVREASPSDARVIMVRATAKGITLLQQGRARRIARLQVALQELPRAELEVLGDAAGVLERVVGAL
ncbi:MAG: MarR family winged helix-turn-helix transcriptional regulator [Gemmatimonadaceae bacterium]